MGDSGGRAKKDGWKRGAKLDKLPKLNSPAADAEYLQKLARIIWPFRTIAPFCTRYFSLHDGHEQKGLALVYVSTLHDLEAKTSATWHVHLGLQLGGASPQGHAGQ